MDHATAQVDVLAGRNGPRLAIYKRLLGYAFALACVVWVFHDIHPRELWSAIRIASWRFVVLSVLFDVLTYYLQGVRWKLLLAPVGRLSALRATQAIYAGLFTNEVVPLRIGELVRGYLVSHWLGRRVSAIVPSMVVERFLDALWLAMAIGLASMFVTLPKDLREAGGILGLLVIGGVGLFLWLVMRRERELEHDLSTANVRPQPIHEESVTTSGGAFSERWRGVVSSIADGLREIGISTNLYLAAALSIGMLACQILALWFVVKACGLDISIGAGAVVLLVVRLGTAIPNAPANVGSFQFFMVVALGMFGVDKTVAAGVSIVDFAVLTLPLWMLGLLAMSRTGMSLASIRAQIKT